MTKNTDNVFVINLSKDVMPIIDDTKGRDEWVNFGVKNDYYDYIFERYKGSPTNNAVINNFAKLIVGGGLESTETRVKPNEWAKLLTTLTNDDLFKLGFDLKATGQCCIQVVGGKQLAHLPIQHTRLNKKNEKGEITGVWFSDKWKDTRKYPPIYLPNYDFKAAKKEIEVIYLKMHTPDQEYYALPDYLGGFMYCEMEEKIAKFLLNDINNGFSGKMKISFINGDPTPEIKASLVREIKDGLTGADGQQLIIEFVDGAESKTIIDTIPLNDAPAHYEYLSAEAEKQVLKCHNVTTPLIFGISTATGFSSNADELKNGWNLYVSTNVKSYQDVLCSAISKFMMSIGSPIATNIKNQNPFGASEKFNGAQLDNIKQSILDVNSGAMTREQSISFLTVVVGISPIEVSKIFPEQTQLSAITTVDTYIELGETMEGFELVSEYVVDYNEEIELASVGTSFPNAKSDLDDENIKVRYAYKGGLSSDTREFCSKMVGANKVWRKEDILKMTNQPVNKGFGVGGSDTYSVWLYKGGARCSHNWVRQLYLKEGTNVDVNSPLAKVIDSFTARAMGSKLPSIGQEVVKPKDMPFKGYTEAYYKKHFQK